MWRAVSLIVMAGSSSLFCWSFVPNARPAFARSNSRLHMTPTRYYDDWELPEDVPSDRRKASSSTDHSSYMTPQRQERLEREAIVSQKFVSGDDLLSLRKEAMNLREELRIARALGATLRVQELEHMILKVQQVDAEFVYAVSLERMELAEKEGRLEDAQVHRQEAAEARSALPQFNLDGLWVGKYGDNCYEMINVTYVGDTLVAYKVTGHSTVPSGEVSFQTNLSPLVGEEDDRELLEPIELGESASERWGIKYLPRFAGEGQVASDGFVNPQFVDGQLILVNDYFSFAWIPLGHQVFFGRPSAELTLKMLRDSPLVQERMHIERCMQETYMLEEESSQDEHSFYSPNQDDYYNQEGCFE